jgi:transcription antitermination factor NusG
MKRATPAGKVVRAHGGYMQMRNQTLRHEPDNNRAARRASVPNQLEQTAKNIQPDDTSRARRWYVVQAHAHREPSAAWHLAHQGFGVYFPQRYRTRRHARRVETVLSAYFPCYLFVSLDLARDQWRRVNGTRGVQRLVVHGEQPGPVPAGFVEHLISRTDGTGILCLKEVFHPGASVEVADGPFGDLMGTLDTLDAGDRARVLLGLLGGASVTLPKSHLMPLRR